MSIFDQINKFRKQKPRIDSQEGEAVPAKAPASDLWVKCIGCGTAMYKKNFQENLKVCEKCGQHHKMTAQERVNQMCDEGSFSEWDADVISMDPLEFGPEYLNKLQQDRAKTKLSDAVLTGSGTIEGLRVALGVMDFHFRGGSMGSAVGEKITAMMEKALDQKLPTVMITSSGGARMQEGMLSLMQMARTSAAVRRLNKAGLPYMCILTDPTTAGVAASFASLGDIILAEPGAIVGFSGARVIEQTIRQKLPPGFQTAEFYQKHGFVDSVVKRSELKRTAFEMLALLTRPVEVAQ